LLGHKTLGPSCFLTIFWLSTQCTRHCFAVYRQTFANKLANICLFCRFCPKALLLAPDLLVVRGNNLPLLSQTGKRSPLSGYQIAGHKQQGG
jgi:hypothetical protein